MALACPFILTTVVFLVYLNGKIKIGRNVLILIELKYINRKSWKMLIDFDKRVTNRACKDCYVNYIVVTSHIMYE